MKCDNCKHNRTCTRVWRNSKKQCPYYVQLTNADRIRSMTDEELAAVLDGYGAYSVCDLVCGGKCYAIASLEKTASQKCREIILAKLREPYKEKENGQTIGTDAEA